MKKPVLIRKQDNRLFIRFNYAIDGFIMCLLHGLR